VVNEERRIQGDEEKEKRVKESWKPVVSGESKGVIG
jgi:hypothetical protein